MVFQNQLFVEPRHFRPIKIADESLFVRRSGYLNDCWAHSRARSLKYEATVNAVEKMSQTADHASNLLSATEQTGEGQQEPAAAGHGA